MFGLVSYPKYEGAELGVVSYPEYEGPVCWKLVDLKVLEPIDTPWFPTGGGRGTLSGDFAARFLEGHSKRTMNPLKSRQTQEEKAKGETLKSSSSICHYTPRGQVPTLLYIVKVFPLMPPGQTLSPCESEAHSLT